MHEVSGNGMDEMIDAALREKYERAYPALLDLAKMQAETLNPALAPYVEDGDGTDLGWPMLRHPLVYQVPFTSPGLANRAYDHKRRLIDGAIEAREWGHVVFLHERPYRLQALLDYCIEHNGEGGEVMPLSVQDQWVKDLAADVWVDSENIQSNIETWRELMCNGLGLWLGTPDERAQFEALPDPIPAWRGGAVGDWSWTTSEETARFFSRQSGYPIRFSYIPKADCFGYLTRRGEQELLVRMTPERERLVYPNGNDGKS